MTVTNMTYSLGQYFGIIIDLSRAKAQRISWYIVYI